MTGDGVDDLFAQTWQGREQVVRGFDADGHKVKELSADVE